jgi:hypothetical protein
MTVLGKRAVALKGSIPQRARGITNDVLELCSGSKPVAVDKNVSASQMPTVEFSKLKAQCAQDAPVIMNRNTFSRGIGGATVGLSETSY